MRNYEDGYFDGENSFFEDFSAYPAAPYAPQFAVMPQQAAATASVPRVAQTGENARWGTGGLGSYQLADPSLAATPDWLKNRDPALNRVDWGGNYDPVTGRLGVLPFFVGGSEAQDASYFQGGDTSDMAGYAGVLETGLPTYNISTEFGRPVDNYLKLNPASENPVRIINASEGKITYEGAADPQGLVSALDQATADGNKNIWSVQEKVGDQWVTTHKNEPIGNLVRDVMLPAMLSIAGGAALGPLLGGTQGTLLGAGKLAAAAGAGLGSAAGSFTGNVAAGKPLDEALKAAAISGVTAGVLKGVMPGGSSGGIGPMPDIDYAGLNNIVFGGGAALPSAALEPMLTATAGKLAGAALPSVFGGAASGLASSAPAEDEILVSNTATPKVDLSGIASLAGVGSPLLETTLNDIVRQYEAPQQMAETPAEDEILVSNTATPKVDLSGLSALGGAAALPGAAANLELPGEELIDVAGNRIPKTTLDSAISAGAGAGAGALNLGTSTNLELPGEELIDVAGNRIPKTTLDSAISAGAGALAPTTPPVDLQPGEELIDVAGNRIPKTELDSTLSAAAAALVPNMPTDLELPGEDLVKDAADDKKDDDKKGGAGSTISKVLTGISLIDALSKLLGGGGGKGGGGTGTAGKLNPIFSAKLPSRGSFLPNADLSPRDMSGVDWKRYGFGPEKSFFNYVPATNDEYKAMLASPRPSFSVQGAGTSGGAGGSTSTAAAPSYRFAGRTEADVLRELAPDATEEQLAAYLETEEGKNVLSQIRANTGPTEKRARGGSLAVKKGGAPAKESFAVKGPGTGRSDEIPALLSDGEYVIDAETVAMLGDGSSEAGAKRLDDFRVNIRKHKGRNLAKGKFSANAKAPERYLSGGRVK
jgi:hypothetical protein